MKNILDFFLTLVYIVLSCTSINCMFDIVNDSNINDLDAIFIVLSWLFILALGGMGLINLLKKN
jgi:hypothetical protein